MAVVFSDKGGHLVLAIQRTKSHVKIIQYVRGKRSIRKVDSLEFRRLYTLSAVNPEYLAKTWLNSTIKMTQEVRKELYMIIEVRMGKIVAKHEEMPAEKKDKSKYFGGADDIVVLKAPEITKLNAAAGGEALASTEKAEMAQATWDAMLAYEIPKKAEKAPKAPKEPNPSRKTYPETGTYTVAKPDHGKKGYRKVIFDLICSVTDFAELRKLTYEQNGKVGKLPACDVFDAIALGIIVPD